MLFENRIYLSNEWRRLETGYKREGLSASEAELQHIDEQIAVRQSQIQEIEGRIRDIQIKYSELLGKTKGKATDQIKIDWQSTLLARKEEWTETNEALNDLMAARGVIQHFRESIREHGIPVMPSWLENADPLDRGEGEPEASKPQRAKVNYEDRVRNWGRLLNEYNTKYGSYPDNHFYGNKTNFYDWAGKNLPGSEGRERLIKTGAVIRTLKKAKCYMPDQHGKSKMLIPMLEKIVKISIGKD